jgi:hypothetical protein
MGEICGVCGLTPDNNACENTIRPVVLDRKNWQFNKSPAEAESSCCIYSLIEMAKHNGLEPFAASPPFFIAARLLPINRNG